METETKPAPAVDTPGTEKKKEGLPGSFTFKPLVHQRNFMLNLLKEKGTPSAACQEAIELAMNSALNSGVSDQDHAEVKKLQTALKVAAKLNDDLAKEKEALKLRVDQLLKNSPYDEPTINALKALIGKKNLKDETAAIKYALTYTLKNDWI